LRNIRKISRNTENILMNKRKTAIIKSSVFYKFEYSFSAKITLS
jgi:hypothetical protein